MIRLIVVVNVAMFAAGSVAGVPLIEVTAARDSSSALHIGFNLWGVVTLSARGWTHRAPVLHRRSRAEKRGEKWAIGCSRDWRNTKLHALADIEGSMTAILFTGREARDCLVAKRLFQRVTLAKHALGDK